MAGIDKLIINSAYREPEHHWKYDMNGQTFVQEPGRRPAGYFIAGQGTNQYNDIGKFIELDLVNKIRPRVKAWRNAPPSLGISIPTFSASGASTSQISVSIASN